MSLKYEIVEEICAELVLRLAVGQVKQMSTDELLQILAEGIADAFDAGRQFGPANDMDMSIDYTQEKEDL